MEKKKLIIFVVLLLGFSLGYILISPRTKTHSANFTSASATLSNARFSYKAGVATGTSGSSTVTIDASGNADNNTNHLFPGDTVCFAGSEETGCLGDVNYSVANIIDSTTFNLTSALTTTLESTAYVVASQSGSLTLAFTTVTEIPANGDLYITIPAVDSTGKTNDGIPDTGASTTANGFDISTIATTDIAVTGCTDVNWTVASITAGDATNDHRILINRATSACAALSAITVTIDSTPGIINPAPLTTHTQGQADSYQINIKSRDGTDATLDSSDVAVAPVEGILVSATVDESLSLTITGITADSGSYCGITRTASSPDTTATSVGWGTLSPTYLAATHNTNHQITVSTNAGSGYKVYVEQNDQMGKDGKVCTGAAAGEADDCIQDTVCDGTGCTHQTYRDWGSDPTSYPGLGYSLQNSSGTDAIFDWDGAGGDTFNAKQFADQEALESRSASTAHIMENGGPVDGSSVYVCYRIDITGTQPAGYYYNKIQYTAVPTF
ncbi:MAG: hypothetical protein QY322_04130 [bacterium]|nr:MAG: hypothetical protein QY322_04130 [bacterium]